MRTIFLPQLEDRADRLLDADALALGASPVVGEDHDALAGIDEAPHVPGVVVEVLRPLFDEGCQTVHPPIERGTRPLGERVYLQITASERSGRRDAFTVEGVEHRAHDVHVRLRHRPAMSTTHVGPRGPIPAAVWPPEPPRGCRRAGAPRPSHSEYARDARREPPPARR